MLNIEAHILSFNEEKMIRHTLNHYSQFCSRIFLHDNMSFDRTRRIAGEYANVTICDFKSHTIDERNYLEIKNNCWKKSKADYVIVCDTDEFLYSENIPDDLEYLKSRGVTLPVVEGYNMYCQQFPHDYSSSIISQVKQGVRARHFDKQLIFDPKRILETNYSPGCHHFAPRGKLLRDYKRPFKLLHYKYLSSKYVSEKHEAYARRLSNYNLQKKYGAEYLNGPEDIKQKFEILEKESSPVI